MAIVSKTAKYWVQYSGEEVNIQELGDMLFYLVYKHEKSYKTGIALSKLYKLAIHEWRNENRFNTKPYLQLVKSWIKIAYSAGFVRKSTINGTNHLHLSTTGKFHVYNKILKKNTTF